MDWKEALIQLVEVAPKLAFKPELIEQLKAHTKSKDPPPHLLASVEVVISVAKQNARVAQLHGYPGLEQAAKKVEIAVQNLVIALKSAGVTPQKNAQAASI